MRKIPKELENPIDNICIDVGDHLSGTFHKLGFTANGLTGMSFLLGLVAIYYYVQKDYVRSSVYFFISYMFDCFDGFYARKYGMVSDFGDALDHARDTTITVGLLFLILKKYWKVGGWRRYLPFAVIPFFIIMEMHIGCQEIYFGSSGPGSKFLSILKHTCPQKTKEGVLETMKITRYFGSGTFMVYIVFLILYSYKVDEMEELHA